MAGNGVRRAVIELVNYLQQVVAFAPDGVPLRDEFILLGDQGTVKLDQLVVILRALCDVRPEGLAVVLEEPDAIAEAGAAPCELLDLAMEPPAILDEFAECVGVYMDSVEATTLGRITGRLAG